MRDTGRIGLILALLLSACAHSTIPSESQAPAREPASADTCREAALNLFKYTIERRQDPEFEQVVFFDGAKRTTLAFFTFGWTKDTQTNGNDRAFYIHFDRDCKVISMGGGTAAMEALKWP